jgi:hypothetical protein
MTYDEFLAQEEMKAAEAEEMNWYDEALRDEQSDSAGQCAACGSFYTLVDFDLSTRTTLCECYDCGRMWDHYGERD